MESLIGLNSGASGTIVLNGKNLHGLDIIIPDRPRFVARARRSPTARIDQKLSVTHNISLASLSRYLRFGSISSRRETESVAGEISDLHIKVADPNGLITALSGGNQQKVVVGKSLLTNPKVLMLDERRAVLTWQRRAKSSKSSTNLPSRA